MSEKGFLNIETQSKNSDTKMTLRSHSQTKLQTERRKFIKRSFSAPSNRYTNSLPENVKIIDNLKLFSKRIKKEMMQNKLNFSE